MCSFPRVTIHLFHFFFKLYPLRGWRIILPAALPKGRDHIYFKSLNIWIIKISFGGFLTLYFPYVQGSNKFKLNQKCALSLPQSPNQHVIIYVEQIAMVGHGLKIITLLKNERYRFTVTCWLVAIKTKDLDTNSNPGFP